MVITTHSDRLIENRRMVLELIFSDHDAYCLPPCQFKCPTRVDIPGYLKQNTLGNWEEATRILKRSLPFPAILGRVCPAPCETHCRREEVDTAIAIRDSHRYCADRVLEVDAPAPIPWPKEPTPVGGWRSSVPARPAWPPPTTSSCAGTTATSSRRSPSRAACSATASRNTASRRGGWTAS